MAIKVDITIVMCEEHDHEKPQVTSNASFRTNCLEQDAEVTDENNGRSYGNNTTIPTCTNSQRISDPPRGDSRRRRSLLPMANGLSRLLGGICDLIKPEP